MIREYHPKDKTSLVKILALNIPKYFAPEEAADFVEYLDQHREDYFVVEEEGQILGSGGVNYFPEAGIARISWDLLAPTAQGKGIGTQLTMHRIKHIQQQAKYHSIVVRTSQVAFGFYEKCGFKLEKIVKDFWAPGFDLYQMKMPAQEVKMEFIRNQYRSGIESYSDFTKEVGLWDSEKYVFQKYLQTTDRILDLGCGTGRTTFPLFKMGYQNLLAVDLTPEMIAEAKQLNEHFETTIDFQVGNACELTFETATFDKVIFSFNGLMSIPNQANRDLALKEIARVLKPKGTFIFTTHDQDAAPEFLQFWKDEKARWEKGGQNPNVFEFGDIITHSKNESRQIFIHIPSKPEINDWLTQNGFEVLESFYRNEKFEESKAVKDKSGECRFWVARKEG